MAEGAGAFVARSFDRMIKDASAKKFADLHKALVAYTEESKIPQVIQSTPAPVEVSSVEVSTSEVSDDGVLSKAVEIEAEPSSVEVVEDVAIEQLPTSPSSEPSTEAMTSLPSKPLTEATMSPPSKPLAEATMSPPSKLLTEATMSLSSKPSTEATVKENASLTTSAILSKAGLTLEGPQAELVLLPLRLAFETKQPKFVEPALDCLHKLISYENLEGDAGLEGGKNAQTSTELFNMVCACADGNASDSTVLQVMKVLLTAVASNKFRVHGECLLSSIRTCYNIILTSKSPINQATSKGTLTQMISIILKRMETETQIAEITRGSSGDVAKSNYGDENGSSTQENSAMDSSSVPEDETQSASVTVEELQHLAGDADIKGLEAALGKAVHPEGGRKMPEGLDLDSMTLAQRNALLVFRTLCKMCMKEENDDVVNKTKSLSLELLQGLLESVSHSFTQNFHFIDSVKAYLCYALLRSCVSSTTSIFQLATAIFSVLLLRFRESLKAEIGVFFPLIILRSLDSSDTHLHQRLAVLKLLERVCKDPQMLADVFANYDCDLEAANLFERMASSLSRMAQGTLNADPSNISLAQNSSIKGSALQCLVSVLRSLVDWAKIHDFNRKTSRGVGIEETSHGSSHEMVSDGRSNEDLVGHVDQFEKAKAHKSILEAAVLEFNRKPEKGIEFLVANKLVENNPTVIAQFLHSTPGLDMQMIGDYLGQFEEFPLAVMHAYVDAMSFKGMKFDVAIREFLKGFRLPGEAQKIDRIMEKFAERYCCENPGLFKSADAAYVLAYAVIMLNTDAHNPMVWPKMTKADFVRMNAGTESYEGVPEDLLSEIYDSIVKDEIKMKEESRSSGKGSRQSDERSRLMRVLNLGLTQRKSVADAKKESEEIVRRTQALFRKGGVKKGVFYMAKQMELVRPMLEAVGWPLLAAFSVTIEDGDNKSQVALCMEGFKLGIHLGKVLGMDTLRYAFLTSLVRFTYLHAPKEMRNKNVEALRTLLNLSENEPDALQDTWNAVLECVSRLEYITSNPSISITLMQGSNQISRDVLTHALNELMGKPTEQVFVNSVRLPSDAIVEFFTALCGVSAEELKQKPPRVFSLQKLVEISYYNMARIRMVWAKIWLLLSQHFVSAGSHHDEKIAMYAIDSLRQLGIKYLERSELANFTFQNDILKPFVVLMRTSQRSSIRALIVDCIIQMVKSKVGSIKSGWKSVFMVFKAAALDQTESIAETAFENMEQVVLEHFDQVVGDCFMDCVHCLIAFANNKCIPRISLKSIALLRICEDRLAEGMIPGGISTPIELENVDSHFDVGEHYWFPMLVGLSELTSDLRTEVRNCALEVLFDLLMERGHKFSPSFWKNVFSDVLFPIFDHIRDAGKDIEKSTHADLDLRETCIHSLKLLCNLFSTFYKEVSFVLPSLLGLLLDCATRADQTLASISVGALTHLIEVGGSHFNEKDWSTLLESIRDACYTTQPVELLNSSNLSDYGSSSRTLSTRASLLYSNGEQAPEITVDHGDGSESHGNGFSFGEVLRIASDNESPVLGRQSEAWETESKGTTIFSEGGNSSTATGTSESQSGGFFSSQSFGRKIMGNMMDTILLRNITFKPKAQYSEISTPAILEQISDFDQQELLVRGDEASVPPSVRSKCIVQLLFLGTLDSLQRKHWNQLQLSHKTTIMDILLSMVDFAGSYNSYINLRNRLQQFSGERPPANLLRQEIEGTRIYLTVLLQCTTKVEQAESSKGFENGILNMDNSNDSEEACRTMEEKFYELGEERLCSFCSHVLKEAADIQPGIGDAIEYDLHYALSLRSPVVIKVIDGLREMEMGTFRKHLPEFYPYFTKLIRCEQVDVRRSLCDLFKVQLVALLP